MANLFGTKNTKTTQPQPIGIVDALNKQGLNLRVTQTAETERADALRVAASNADESAIVAANHAKAVEEAVAILDAAGVKF